VSTLPSVAVMSRLWALVSQEELLAAVVLLHGLKLSSIVSTQPTVGTLNWLPCNSPLTQPYFARIWYGLHTSCSASPNWLVALQVC
jgi:hypothetical protein